MRAVDVTVGMLVDVREPDRWETVAGDPIARRPFRGRRSVPSERLARLARRSPVRVTGERATLTMDPNACLERIANLLRRSAGDPEAGTDLDFACQDLFDWISRGGFEPTNKADHPSAWSYYECRAVSHRRGERVTE